MTTTEFRPAGSAGHDLDPGIRQFVRTVTEAMAGLSVAQEGSRLEVRRLAEDVRSAWARGGPAMHLSADRICATRHGDVRLRIHRPDKGCLPALVYLHGGGWTMFSVDTHDRVMREYAARSGCAVIGVDYALSPEARYPIALEQIIDVLGWVRKEGASLDLDPGRLAVGGDSAGANLAVATCLSLRDADSKSAPTGMILNYGAYTTECSRAACRSYGGPAYMLGCEEMAGFWRDYMRDEHDADDPLVCPLLARLEELPPAFLVIAECDILAEQNLMMADRLRASGVAVDARTYTGASHSFLEAITISAVSERALADSAEWLRSLLFAS